MVTRGPPEVQLTAVIRAGAVNFQAGHAGSIPVARSAGSRDGQVSTRTCWMLMISWPSYDDTVYQIVTPSEGRCSS